jgi:PAS domain S-box-containing protein
MTQTLRVLLVEDSENDALLLLRELRRGSYEVTHRRVDTEPAMRQALAQEQWDIILSDYSMPVFSAMAALQVLKDTGLDIPFIVVSGTIGEETAVEILIAGADDFLLKHRLARFLPAVERALRDAATRRERRLAEQALRESELKYRRIVETAQEGIWMLDSEARTSFVNRRMAQMLGSFPEEMAGTSAFEFMDEKWKKVAQSNLDRRRQGIAEQHEFEFRRRDGTAFWASVSTNPIFDESGNYLGSLAMVADLTERRKLQEQLMVADRMVSVGTLAAGVAHEINNPLTAVLGNLHLATRELAELAQRWQKSVELQELCDELQAATEAAERMRDIVRDLRIFSRAESEEAEPVDVQRILESSLRMAWTEIRHRARLVKDYRPVPLVAASESRLGQVFLNLIVNAAQAIPEGRVESNEIRVVTGVDGNGRVFVEVRDTGSGMPPEVLRSLFTPFFTTKPAGVGTGLGLSICHRIVSSLGGEIVVDSEPGKGSSFRVFLPPAADRQVRTTVSPAARAALRRGRILVVDDEPMIGELARRVLSADHDVVATTSGSEALSKFTAGERFDAILV